VRPISPEQLARTCAHEAGHALMFSLLPSLARCNASVRPEGTSRGHVYYPRKSLNNITGLLFEMQLTLAGREAERTLLWETEYGTGSISDLKDFEYDARDWCLLQDDGPLLLAAATSDAEAGYNARLLRQLRQEQIDLVRTFLEVNRDVLQKLADALDKHRFLDEEHLTPLLSGVIVTPGLARPTQPGFAPALQVATSRQPACHAPGGQPQAVKAAAQPLQHGPGARQ